MHRAAGGNERRDATLLSALSLAAMLPDAHCAWARPTAARLALTGAAETASNSVNAAARMVPTTPQTPRVEVAACVESPCAKGRHAVRDDGGSHSQLTDAPLPHVPHRPHAHAGLRRRRVRSSSTRWNRGP